MRRAAWLLALALGAPAGAQDKPASAPDAEGIEFFEKKIRPVLVDACYSCHSPQAKSLKGGLRLDTRDTVLKGGDSGPSIVPGDPDKSLLIKAIRGADENLAMPPKKRLPKEVVADFEAWVRRGAPDPRHGDPVAAADAAKVKGHWAFRPPVEPTIPAVKNAGWVRSPVDAFVLARLEAAGFKPQPEADRRTLIRRVTFDLTGLPPTPEEVDAFVSDKDPQAYEKLVDRLLASPAYGERWARHWLDVARYSDTKGYVFQEERRYPFAYTYRDWVVRAFNEDMPYDRFVTMQIAADRVVTGEDKRDLAAMGFLTVGRRFLNNQPDIIDDRIDVVTRGFMALTVGCARCHDHKYDPIPIKDYYSLYGVFASSEEPKDLPVISSGKKSPENLAYEKELERLKSEVDAFRAQRLAEKVKALRAAKAVADHLLAAREGASMKDEPLRELARKKDLTSYLLERWIARVKKDDAVFGLWTRYAGLPDGEFAEKAKGVKVDGPVADAFKAPPASLKEAAERYGKALAEAPEGSPLRQALHETTEVGLGDLDKLYNRKDRDEQRAREKKIEAHKASHPGAPEHAMVVTDRGSPVEPRVFIRGNPNNLGPQVPRRFLSVVAGENAAPFKDGSGRLELARAIVAKDNPLTARVFVNRVWGHHFGRPLVGTPSDFGLRSDLPTHPELLDWLAAGFRDGGQSLKQLHRLIVTSATY
ncbi:MAG TPA: DUF1549 domain-containing protein, partial [Planctomycetota bacterium]|nr:DUF1549 domain-containing protein [Planctomycetota bacterium]